MIEPVMLCAWLLIAWMAFTTFEPLLSEFGDELRETYLAWREKRRQPRETSSCTD